MKDWQAVHMLVVHAKAWIIILVLVGVFCLAKAYTPSGWQFGHTPYGASVNPFLAAIGAASLVGAFLIYRSQK